MKAKLIILSIVIALIAMEGCRCKQALTTVVTDSLYIKQELKPIVLPADSSSIKALFECDSTNKVLLRKIDGTSTKGLSATYNFSDGLFSYYVLRPVDTVYVRRDSIVKSKPVVVSGPKVIVAEMNNFQRTFFWIGIIASVLCIVILSIKIYKSFNK